MLHRFRFPTLLALAVALIVLGTVSSGSTVDAAAGSGAKDVIPGQYIVVFNDDVAFPGTAANDIVRRNGLSLRHTYAFALRGFAASIPQGRLNAIANDPRVAFVEPDLEVHALLHENDFQTLPTGVDRIDAGLNATANIDGVDDRVDVDIAIIDTGIDLDHPDLNVFKNKGFIRRVKSGNDDNGHGSGVAGTAAALDNGIGVVGVAPGARLWALKVLDRNGSGSFSDVIKAIDFVTKNADQIEVVNMSLSGTGRLDSLRMAIQNSVNAGVVYVVSAGNSSSDVYGEDGVFEGSEQNDDIIPAAYPEVAAISAMGDTDGKAGGLGPNTSRGTADDTFADFTNFSNSVVAGNPVTSSGAAIDLAGPGVDITTTAKDGLYFVDSFSGTSASSPHVAGSAALEAATNGRATDAAGVAAIRQALIDAAEPQSAWGPANTNEPDANAEGLANVASGPPLPPGTADPSTSTITADPTSTTANGSSTSSITVQLKDSNGDNLTTGGDTVTLSTDLGSLSAVTDNNNGTYTATLTSGTTTGTATITGTVNTEAITDTATVDFTPGTAVPSTSTITADPTSIPADDTSTSTITVQLKDSNANNLTSVGDTVTLGTDLGSLSVVTDNGDGTYTATLTAGTTAGTATVTGTLNEVAMTDTAAVEFTAPAAETITITKATFNSRKGQLKVEATSSLGGATSLTATFFDGTTELPVGGEAMTYNAKKDKWSVTFTSGDGLDTKPDSVKVCSPNTCVERTDIGGK